MSISRSVAEVLRDHVALEVEAVDCNVYQPLLRVDKMAAAFFRYHRGCSLAFSDFF